MIGRPTCKLCKHYRTPDKRVTEGKCDAFPDGIPEMVIAHMIPWERPKVCNNGIGFELIEDETNE